MPGTGTHPRPSTDDEHKDVEAYVVLDVPKVVHECLRIPGNVQKRGCSRGQSTADRDEEIDVVVRAQSALQDRPALVILSRGGLTYAAVGILPPAVNSSSTR